MPTKADSEMRIWFKTFIWEVFSGSTVSERREVKQREEESLGSQRVLSDSLGSLTPEPTGMTPILGPLKSHEALR